MLKARWSEGQRRIHPARQPPEPRKPKPRKRPQALWYALSLRDRDAGQLIMLAKLCSRFTDYVSVSDSAGEADAVLFEVRGSLRYFGGLAGIRTRLHSALQRQLPHAVYAEAVSPSPSASLLLVRQGVTGVVADSNQLRAALGNIRVDSLPLDKCIRTALQRCGLICLRDLWRLPARELRLRFGRELTHYLEKLKAERAESLPRWYPAPEFGQRLNLEYSLQKPDHLLRAADSLLAALQQFLKHHHLQTDWLDFTLYCGHHERRLVVRTRIPTQRIPVFRLLLENRLQQLSLPAPVDAVSLRVSHLQPFVPAGAVPQRHRNSQQMGSCLADILAARLGHGHIYRFQLHESHAPEQASRLLAYLNPEIDESWDRDAWVHKNGVQKDIASPYAMAALPPLWLIDPPRRLWFRDRKLYYRSYLHLLRGPQRIESLWWNCQRLRRDYYVAHNEEGMVLWVYHDLSQRHATDEPCWYLHGLFG